MIFQANGSNYDFLQSLRLLFSGGSQKDSDELRDSLSKHYGGQVILFSKGRGALSEAVRVSSAKVTAVNGYTCSVVVEAITSSGSTPKYLDIEPTTAHFSTQTLAKAIEQTPNLEAVIVQNTYGIPCDIAGIEALTQKYNLVLIEDLAHSIGQTYADGREVGTVGDLVMLSFGRDKMIDVGSGGALVVRNPKFNERVVSPDTLPPKKLQRQDRWYPILSWFVRALYPVKIGQLLLGAMFRFGWVSRSSDGGIHREYTLLHWQARQVVRLLKDLDESIASRHEKAAEYASSLGYPLAREASIRVPLVVEDQSAALAACRREHFMLDDTWYDIPIGPKRKYIDFAFPEDECPEAVKFAGHVINLPTHQFVTVGDQAKLAQIIAEQKRV